MRAMSIRRPFTWWLVMTGRASLYQGRLVIALRLVSS
jgi:hypothetical protein